MNSLKQPKDVVSVRYGKLRLSGCPEHPHSLDMSCCQIRKADGVALTVSEVWDVLTDLTDQEFRRKTKT